MYTILASGIDAGSHRTSVNWRGDWASIDILSGGSTAELAFARTGGGLAIYQLDRNGQYSLRGPSKLQLPKSGPLGAVRVAKVTRAGKAVDALATIDADSNWLQFYNRASSIISPWGAPTRLRSGLKEITSNQWRNRGRELLFRW